MKKSSKPLRIHTPKVQGAFRSRSPDMYPPVDPTKFTASAEQSLNMANQLTSLLKKITDSKTFASQLMDAAQRSNQPEVDRLMKSAGMNRSYSLKFNPQGFHLELKNEDAEHPCCKVEMTLYWSE